MSKWDHRFIELAKHIATWSKDMSTKVGVVVVGPQREIRSTGYSGFPPGVDDNALDRHQRPQKYLFFAHAEENSIAFAALNGVTLAGCTIYATMFPCATCARLIIRAGITRVVVPQPKEARADWAESHAAARVMFKEAHVEVFELAELTPPA